MEIDLSPAHLETVAHILAKQVPECEVRAFGSRVKGTARKYSDLDLAVIGNEQLGISRFTKLSVAFEESSLPFNVDVLDWHTMPQSFRQGVEKGYVVLQEKPE